MRNTLISENNNFSRKMLYEMGKQTGGKSFVHSAYSLLVPLLQLQLGAHDGPTRDEIRAALGMHHIPEMPQALSSFNKNLSADTHFKLNMASRIYVSDKFDLNDEYVDNTRQYFQTEPVKIDVSKNEETAAAINKWVADETNNRIKDLIDPNSIKPSDIAILVNAIYFKGVWAKPFAKAFTQPGNFYVSEQDFVTLPIMYNKYHYDYAESTFLDAKILKVPFTGHTSAMIFVLPNKIDGLAHLLQKFEDPFAVFSATRNLTQEIVRVSIPKFKIETTTNLKNVLKNIGIEKVFDPQLAQLDNILKGKTEFSIGSAFQKAFIRIDESGAEAAGTNAVRTTGATRFDKPKDFTADHPFMFFIQAGGAILFSGVFSAKD